MLTIRAEQMEVLRAAAQQRFQESMRVHLNELAYPLAFGVPDGNLRKAISFGVARARGYGFDLRGPVRLYLELMLIMGSHFDTDPQYSWAAAILKNPGTGSQMARAERLYQAALDYEEEVIGTDYAQTVRAITSISFTVAQPLAVSPDTFVPDMLRTLRSLYPEKACYVGEAGLKALIREAQEDAQRWGLMTVRGASMLIILKMMFIGAAYVIASRGRVFRPADKKTIAYVPLGYSKYERLTIELLRKFGGFAIVAIEDSDAIVKYINERPEYTEEGQPCKLLLQDVAFFSHGFPGWIALNYGDDPDVDFGKPQLDLCGTDVFVPGGRLYSYACRTGVSKTGGSFSSDAEAGLETSLAQQIANHFRIEVHAFLRRSFYGEVLRKKTDSKSIGAAVKAARATHNGQVIEIPPEHQAFPHPGLADGWFNGARTEGTSEYALWRKAGGLVLPTAAETPSGLTEGMCVFKPK